MCKCLANNSGKTVLLVFLASVVILSSCGGSSQSGTPPTEAQDASVGTLAEIQIEESGTPAVNQSEGIGTDQAQLFNGAGLLVDEMSFSTPEDAISYFVAAIADNDLHKAIAACGINELAQYYDAAADATRTRVISAMNAFPPEFEFYQDLNQIYFFNKLASQIRNFTYGFMDSDTAKSIAAGQVVPLEKEFDASAEQFISEIDPSVLKSLTVKRMDLPYPDVYNGEENQRNLKAQTDIYQCDDITDRVVLYELSRQTYTGGFTLMKYGDSWKIVSLSSAIGGQSVYGTAEPMSEVDYLQLLG